MEDFVELKETIREFSCLAPIWGYASVKARLDEGDVPLIFRNLNEDGSSDLVKLMERNLGEEFSEFEKDCVAHREYQIKFGAFMSYQGATTFYVVNQIYNLVKDFF